MGQNRDENRPFTETPSGTSMWPMGPKSTSPNQICPERVQTALMNSGARTEPVKPEDSDVPPSGAGGQERREPAATAPHSGAAVDEESVERLAPSSRPAPPTPVASPAAMSPAHAGASARKSAAEARNAYRSNEPGRRMVCLLY